MTDRSQPGQVTQLVRIQHPLRDVQRKRPGPVGAETMAKVQQYLCELEAYNTLVSIGSVLFQVRLLDSNVLCDQRGVTIAAWWISGHDKFLFM